MEPLKPHPRFNRTLVLRAYAMFIDALVATLIAAPLQWVFFAADELMLYWLTFVVMNVAMQREFEGTLGMKLLGLVALKHKQAPPLGAVLTRILLAYAPLAAGFVLAARSSYSDTVAIVAPVLVGLSAAEWLRATLRIAGDMPAPPFWDRLTGIEVIRV